MEFKEFEELERFLKRRLSLDDFLLPGSFSVQCKKIKYAVDAHANYPFYYHVRAWSHAKSVTQDQSCG